MWFVKQLSAVRGSQFSQAPAPASSPTTSHHKQKKNMAPPLIGVNISPGIVRLNIKGLVEKYEKMVDSEGCSGGYEEDESNVEEGEEEQELMSQPVQVSKFILGKKITLQESSTMCVFTNSRCKQNRWK